MRMAWCACAVACLVVSGCDGCEDDARPGGGDDAGVVDGGGSLLDAGAGGDAGAASDASDAAPVRDAGSDVGGGEDVGAVGDGGASDGGGEDAGVSDGGVQDAGVSDAGVQDAGVDGGEDVGVDSGGMAGACVSGAAGTYAARFRWEGNGSGSRAYVVYEENNLPDTSRWKAGAFSANFSYRPVFSDPFLGDGGLEMGSTVFMDIELSTAGLSSISNVTLSLLGRSFNTTSPGSFSWQTISGTGASPRGGVSNSAPYQWYSADATAAIPAGDGGILLRIRPEGPSNRLVVRAFEVCIAGQ